jgi:hypothetical protein
MELSSFLFTAPPKAESMTTLAYVSNIFLEALLD